MRFEIYTHASPREKARKFIFQCKYLKPGSSFTASRVEDISDTIDQYAAESYGIMTNVTIDATLYDKINRLGAAKKIAVNDYSLYKLE
jgi:hypothetical protein